MDLQRYNSFRVRAETPQMYTVRSTVESLDLLNALEDTPYIIGGGSNILLVDDLRHPVVLNRIKGIQVVREEEDFVEVEIGAGEPWHDFVRYAVQQGWGGVENLALIPGTAGAAPIQNIGAYGREISEVLERVRGLYYDSSRWKQIELDRAQCQFGYRNSIFKKELQGRFMVSSLVLRLTKRNHQICSTYWSLQSWLEKRRIVLPDIKTIFEAVVDIRRQRLPDPKVLPNAGSFFKNVFVSEAHFLKLKSRYEDLPVFELDGLYKIPTGWLIEKCGWKGKRWKDVGTYTRQALILVNYGTHSGRDIYHLAGKIMRDVYDRFGIVLEPEVQIWPKHYRERLYQEYAIPLPAHKAKERQR